MAEPPEAGEILKRALGYPYAAPRRSFVQLGERTLELPAGGPDLRGRSPLLAYGANAAPAALARKLAPLAELELPLLRAELEGFDVVYSAHISPYGAVPATLRRSPGTVVELFVSYPTEQQRRLLTATELNYERHRLAGIRASLETGAALEQVDAYVSRHGCLSLDGGEIALAAVEARGRSRRAMAQRQVLDRIRAELEPKMGLWEFVASSLEAPLAASRTARLRAAAVPALG